VAGKRQLNSSGQLILNNSGDILNSADDTCCCQEPCDCPTDCSGCATTFTLTIAGLPTDCCPDINGSYTLTYDPGAGACQWDLSTSPPICSGFLIFTLKCLNTTCNGVSGYYWTITVDISVLGVTYYFTMPTAGNCDCPPLGVYTQCAEEATSCSTVVVVTLSS
jgi:hypothetical protein